MLTYGFQQFPIVGPLRENKPIDRAYLTTHHTKRACQSTMDICKAADHFLQLDLLKGQSSLNIEELYPDTHFFEHEHPKIDLIKIVLMEYIRYKGNYIAKTVSANEIKENIRRKLARLIINNNQ